MFRLSRLLMPLVATLATAACSVAGPAPLRLGLGPEGETLGWLVAGPYPNEGALQLRGTGFRTDYLGGESAAAPIEGQKHGAYAWRFATASAAAGLDLKALLKSNDPGIAYCYTTLTSPTEREARLLFGSDDGAKVFLNGALIFEKQIARGVKRDEDQVAIRLKAGENRLLFKIEQGDGGWGLVARIVDLDGKPIPGLVQVLQVDDGLKDTHAKIRSLSGKPGTFDLYAYEENKSLRSRAERLLKNLRSRAAKPERLEAILSAAPKLVASSEGDPEKFSSVLRSVNAEISAAYMVAREPLVKWAQDPGPLVKANPAGEDFVKVMPEGRYFVRADGRPFIPIGYNHNPDWTELALSDPLDDKYNPGATDRWFANLKAHGVNVVRMMIETPPSGNVEERPGLYRPEHVIWLDSVFNAARKHGIKLWVTPYDTFWMNLRADASPYWKANGGPIEQPVDFLTKPALMDLQKRRMKFLIDRYGNLGTVFAWEIMNEVDLWWKASPEQIRTWTDEMSKYVRDYQRQRWGRDHMVTMSFAEAMPKGLNAETAFRRADFDFATMHLYIGASKAPKPHEAEQAGIDFASGVVYAREQIKDNRPVLDGESGPIDKWIQDPALDNEVFHQMSWHHLLAGGAGPGTRWPYRGPHHLTPGMLDTLKAIRAFTDDAPWKLLTGPTVDVTVAQPVGAKANVFGTRQAAIAWLRTPNEAKAQQFALYWQDSARPAKFRLFDVRRGTWIGGVRCSVDKDGIRFNVPAGVQEVAVWISR